VVSKRREKEEIKVTQSIHTIISNRPYLSRRQSRQSCIFLFRANFEG
jgi:hypothetical protein